MKSFKQKINAYVGIVVALALLLIWHLNFWFASLLEDHQQESILGADPHAAAFRLENSHGRQGGNEKGKLKNFDHRKQQRQPQPPEQLLSASHDKNNGYSFHIVVSSGCNSLQDWQSYTFFHAIKQSGFEGNVTRVASCETEEQATALKQLHQEQISIMSPNFHLFTTPDFTRMAGPEKYNFFNKPFGVRYWLEHGLGLPANLAEYEKTIMVLMDPDQFLLRPFVQDMAHEQELWHDPTGYRQVKKGQPMAAKYSFGGAWTRDIDVKNLLDVNLTVQRIPKEESGLLRNWNAKYMGKYFAIGAPYVVETADFLEIVQSWAEFVVPIYKQMKAKGKDPFMAEMYGYCAAGAHLNLRHQMSNSFMISEPESGSDSEAWSEWIDGKSSQSVCSPDMSPMPHSFHFCQRYYIGVSTTSIAKHTNDLARTNFLTIFQHLTLVVIRNTFFQSTKFLNRLLTICFYLVIIPYLRRHQ